MRKNGYPQDLACIARVIGRYLFMSQFRVVAAVLTLPSSLRNIVAYATVVFTCKVNVISFFSAFPAL